MGRPNQGRQRGLRDPKSHLVTTLCWYAQLWACDQSLASDLQQLWHDSKADPFREQLRLGAQEAACASLQRCIPLGQLNEGLTNEWLPRVLQHASVNLAGEHETEQAWTLWSASCPSEQCLWDQTFALVGPLRTIGPLKPRRCNKYDANYARARWS